MKPWKKMGIGTAILGGAGLAIGYGNFRNAMGQANDAYARLASRPVPPPRRFDPSSISGLPEIAQRYFRHAIAPGTPLYSTALLEMEGIFLLGNRQNHQAYRMSARQVLRPPTDFVWIPRLRCGIMRITGSDALVEGEAWTRFWLLSLLPVADVASSPDMVRSAQFRGAVEGALWLPTTMLPDNGTRWEQVGPHEARVALLSATPAIVLHLTLDERGAVRKVLGQRWSNANAEQRFKLQSFGGTMNKEATFQGLTIPVGISVGNHYGTKHYLPFFQAQITTAKYL